MNHISANPQVTLTVLTKPTSRSEMSRPATRWELLCLSVRAPSGEDGIMMRKTVSRLGVFYVDIAMLRPGTIGAYLLAFVSVLVATALRLAIDPFVGVFSSPRSFLL
jgi:hypothetical protein